MHITHTLKMGAYWSSTHASKPAPVPVPVSPVHPILQRRLDNDLSSRLLQLHPDLRAKIASSLPPMSVTNKSLGSSCSGLQAMSHASMALEVSSRMFDDEPRARAFLARYHSLRSLKISVKRTVFMSPLLRLDLGALQTSSMALRLQNLELVGHSILTPQDCEVITGLTSLTSLRIVGFTIAVLNLSTSVTEVTLDHCTLTTKEVTGAGIRVFRTTDSTSQSNGLDLSRMPAVQELHTGAFSGELVLSLPSALETLTSRMLVAGEVLSQLTCLTTLKCQTQSQVVDLHACKLRTLSIMGAILTRVDVSDCKDLTFVKAQGSLLTDLGVHGCNQLHGCDLSNCALLRQPFQPGTMWRLRNLDLSANPRLTDVSDLPSTLETLDLCGCASLVIIPPLLLWRLHSLDVSSCHRLTGLDITGCPLLQDLRRHNCSNLGAVNGIDRCAAHNKGGKKKDLRCEHPSKPNSKYCGVHRNHK